MRLSSLVQLLPTMAAVVLTAAAPPPPKTTNLLCTVPAAFVQQPGTGACRGRPRRGRSSPDHSSPRTLSIHNMVSTSPRRPAAAPAAGGESRRRPKAPPASPAASSSAKYPTVRGSEVDSRKIVATGAGRRHLTAVRVRHVLFLSEDLARSSLHQIRSADGTSSSFDDLARSGISACSETRDEGGEVGWVAVSEDEQVESDVVGEVGSDQRQQRRFPNEHLDGVFPREARETAIRISTKPGDVFVVQSSRGYHVVQARVLIF